MSTKEDKVSAAGKSGQPDERHSAGRRAMLKGVMTAMPAVLTLHSGAALARSSNMVSTTKYKTPDRRGRTLCLDLNTVRPARVGRGNTYEIGRYVHVNAINDREYYVTRRGRRRQIDVSALCERGGAAYHKEGGRWHQINLPKGGMLSAAPLASMAASAKIDITDI